MTVSEKYPLTIQDSFYSHSWHMWQKFKLILLCIIIFLPTCLSYFSLDIIIIIIIIIIITEIWKWEYEIQSLMPVFDSKNVSIKVVKVTTSIMSTVIAIDFTIYHYNPT